MALPVTITGIEPNRRVVGPYLSSGGNFYLFAVDVSNNTNLLAYKSTAPDTSWSSVATNAGFSTSVLGLAGVQNADVIHLVANDGTGTSFNYKYRTFNMATDAFVLSENIVSAINPQDSGAGVYGLCEIVFRSSDSQPLVLYPGPQVSGRSKVNYKVRTGVATWSAAVVVDAAAATTDYYPTGIAPGASGTTHFLYLAPGTGAGMYERALTSANALQTRVTLTGNFNGNGSGKGWSLVSGGTTKVSYVNNNSSTSNGLAIYFDSASVPTVNSSGAIGASAAINFGSMRLFVDGADFWTVYSRSDTGDMYSSKSSDFGATWSTETLSITATNTTTGPNGDEWMTFPGNGGVYPRAGNQVFGYVYNDSGTHKYNEIVLRALTPSTANFFNNPVLP